MKNLYGNVFPPVIVREQIKSRGIKVFTGLGRHLRQVAKDTDGAKVNKYELEKALINFHIQVPQEVRKSVFITKI